MRFNSLNYKNLKWKVALLLCLASVLSYIDRNTLAILAPAMQKELNWSDVDYADVTALFVLSYTIMYAISDALLIGLESARDWPDA